MIEEGKREREERKRREDGNSIDFLLFLPLLLTVLLKGGDEICGWKRVRNFVKESEKRQNGRRKCQLLSQWLSESAGSQVLSESEKPTHFKRYSTFPLKVEFK